MSNELTMRDEHLPGAHHPHDEQDHHDHHHHHGHDHDHSHEDHHDHHHDHHHHGPKGRITMDPLPVTPRKQWRSLDEVAAQPGFEELLNRDYPRQAAAYAQSGFDRRTFLKIMGSALALVGVNGCTTRPPTTPIVPYVQVPEEIVTGRPVYYASSATLGGVATGVLIETHEGRPTRLDGNPRHPASLGASDVFSQASILELYNPERSTVVRNAGVGTDWEEFRAGLRDALAAAGDGSGLRILTETVTSPTLTAEIQAVLAQYPAAQWVQYEPVNDDSSLAGTELAFGEALHPVYRFAAAEVILSLDADFLTGMPGSLRYAREFAERRRVRAGSGEPKMNRLYAVESMLTNVGAMAEHRLVLRPSAVEGFARALAAAVGVDGGDAASGEWDAAWLEALAADLEAHRGTGLVVAGRSQPPAVHALAHAINAALGNVGSTVTYTAPLSAGSTAQTEALRTLVDAMAGGAVSTLIILGGNPVYTAPADVDFAGALAQVETSVHLSLYYDETSAASTWHVPQTHFVEEWGDARAYDGTVSIVQPPIAPLYPETHSAYELLAEVLQDTRDPYDLVRATWQAVVGDADFEAFWNEALVQGVVGAGALTPVTLAVRGDLAAVLPAAGAAGSGVELYFRPDAKLWDGRFAANSWLQELPDPITKLSWDNAALVSPQLAQSLGVKNEDVVSLSYGGRVLEAPVWIAPGLADNVVALSLGYGRTGGSSVGIGAGVNANLLRTAASPWFGSGVEVAATGATYQLATTQARYQADLGEPIRKATLEEFVANPEFVKKADKYAPATLLKDYVYDDYAWGMAIDLNACVGCNACVIACQTENNIPSVGKDQVAMAREMYWLRVDRYFEGELENPETFFQPVPCMQCETAPCEVVCPVQATVHSDEGLNQMVYNRCVGTRYCSANCPYGVRRFNFKDYVDEAKILIELRNPDVSVRAKGVMEKCTYCTQRISAARIEAKKEGRAVRDGEILPACASACPTQAIVFGDMNDANSWVAQLKAQPQHYALLGEVQTKPRTTYLARLSNPNTALGESEA